MTTTSKDALDMLKTGVQDLTSSDAWRKALDVRSRLHTYSFRNSLLISMQNPDATMVAGYRKWQELGRQVRKGEKGLAILAPLVRRTKDEDDEEERTVYGFRTAYVFDVSQTDGDDIPNLVPDLLAGSDEEAEALLTSMEAFAHARGCATEYVDGTGLASGAKGAYYRSERRIAVRGDLPPLHRLKTLVHEIAHHLLHSEAGGDDRATKELEAESAAYIVCASLGLDTGDYSFAYLASWGGDDEDALLTAGERAMKAADQMLTATQDQHALAA